MIYKNVLDYPVLLGFIRHIIPKYLIYKPNVLTLIVHIKKTTFVKRFSI